MICHVYRRGRLYWGKLRLETDANLLRFPLHTTDRRVAQGKLLEIVKQREKEAAGLLPPQSAREAATQPLEQLRDTYLDDVQARGGQPATLDKYRSNLKTCFTGCHWNTLQKVNARSFSDWRKRCGLSPKTLKDIEGVLMAFLDWLVHQRLAVENPLAYVERTKIRGTGSQCRRALGATELAAFLAVAPARRRIVYLVAVFTGLRRRELAALRWSDIHGLDSNERGANVAGADTGTQGHKAVLPPAQTGGQNLPSPAALLPAVAPAPAFHVRAATTKSRKSAVLPMHPEILAALRAYRPHDAAPFAPVFSTIPRVRTLRRDLVEAGIPFLDEHGRRADFHSLRMTFGTNLTLSGAAPRVVMELMRHSDIKLTMKIYTDAGKLPLSEAISRLPTVATSSSSICRTA